MMRQMGGVFLGLVMSLALVSCSSCTSHELELTAMRSAQKVISPLYRGYVETDPALAEPEKQAERAVLESWRHVAAAGDLDAEPAIYQHIAPRFTAYVNGDDKLDDRQKARRVRLVTAWRMRLEEPR